MNKKRCRQTAAKTVPILGWLVLRPANAASSEDNRAGDVECDDLATDVSGTLLLSTTSLARIRDCFTQHFNLDQGHLLINSHALACQHFLHTALVARP